MKIFGGGGDGQDKKILIGGWAEQQDQKKFHKMTND